MRMKRRLVVCGSRRRLLCDQAIGIRHFVDSRPLTSLKHGNAEELKNLPQTSDPSGSIVVRKFLSELRTVRVGRKYLGPAMVQ